MIGGKQYYGKWLEDAMFLLKKEEAVSFPGNSRAIRNKLKRIPDSFLVKTVGMAELPLILYLLWLKYKGDISLVPAGADAAIRAGGTEMARMSYLAVYIHFMEVKDGILGIEGNISYPSVLGDDYAFYARSNGKKVTAGQYGAGLDLKLGGNVYEVRTAFKLCLELKGDTEIHFYNNVAGLECPYGKINAMRFSPVADCIEYQYCILSGWMVYMEGNKIVCKRAGQREQAAREKLFCRALRKYRPEKAEWASGLRKLHFAQAGKKGRPIWLFMDRMEQAGDNASVLFRYVQRYEDIDSYFILSRESEDFGEMEKYGNVVEAYSQKHYLLVFAADYIISSQANGAVENPFWQEAEMFRDLYHRARLIFLQHGVIKDDMSATLHRYHTNFTGFVTSSPAERKSILEYPYHYTEKQVWLTGLPRFDELYDRQENYILIMPSWRKGLMEQVWDGTSGNMVWKPGKDFRRTEYFRRFRSLVRNRRLRKACRRYGYRLAFMPHPLMREYGLGITEGSECAFWGEEIPYKEAFAKGSLLITDYSSVAFDFAFLEKPVLYYQFDRKEFFANHTYRKGYFDYGRDGFGEVTCRERELVGKVCALMEKGMKAEGKYRRRMEQVFAYRDRDNCRRIYRRLADGMEEKETGWQGSFM